MVSAYTPLNAVWREPLPKKHSPLPGEICHVRTVCLNAVSVCVAHMIVHH